jgi:hypothetical protein
MQLDNATIAIRERSLSEILDLALHVLRAHLGPLCALAAVGAAPALLVNHWLVDLVVPDVNWESDQYLWVFLNLLLVLVETPIVLGPVTAYLGQATFQPRADYRRLIRDVLRSLPQLILVQVLLRGLTLMLTSISRPYAGEVILLERNRLAGGPKGAMTTRRRVAALHQGWFGELLGRWLAVCGVALLIATALTHAIASTTELFAGGFLESWFYVKLAIPLAFWLTAFFLTVVRFLAYLDLRIRREGWEIELDMRAEALRLTRQPA